MKNVLITICGRAGSKGFKNKNLKVFLNKPLVYYTLRSAFDFKARVKDADHGRNIFYVKDVYSLIINFLKQHTKNS